MRRIEKQGEATMEELTKTKQERENLEKQLKQNLKTANDVIDMIINGGLTLLDLQSLEEQLNEALDNIKELEEKYVKTTMWQGFLEMEAELH